ncbi:glycine cleavage system aminomethyltransferase GcvT [Desulfovibrio ferrophilus]|uniref:aminomethyltransferase n=1 Tax=Desulfovibrio ferrophilus TaxID=241368 RepID=A0A2Z6AWL2_9BACT|nr:glycine cleavage system aminomethyltransferase GcvT [Desulfovibrio ferrophilus]BBD07642.1 aminomethyltransferase [Desulfovibrio ferrophilus]
MSDLFKTPLHAWHVENGAKMVPFAGWDMPVQYSGILEEHHHTRTKASIFDICHMGEFKLMGPKAKSALANVVTHNLNTLGPGRCRYGFLLNEQGGILDDLIVYCLADDEYMLVVNGARATADYAWIKSHLPEDMFFENISDMTAKIDLQGPESCKVLNRLMGEDWSFLTYFACKKDEFDGDPLLISRTGYTGELGYELYLREDKAIKLWEKLVSISGVKPAGLGARDTLRLEMGMALYGQDLDENHTPAEAGMGFFLKSETDYIGKAHGMDVRVSLVPLALEGRRAARHDDPVFLPSGEEVGHVTSGSFAPSLGHSVALAYIKAEHADNAEFLLGKGKKKITGKKADLPFYTKGTARIKL